MAATIPDDAIAGFAIAAGFPQNEIVTAVAVALAESSGNPAAVNHNTDGSTDSGLWQINSIHTDLSGNPFDPSTNAKMAFTIWQRAGGKWTPWSAYTSGRYRMFTGRAQVAAGQPDTSKDLAQKYADFLNGGAFQEGTEPLQALSAVSDFLAKLVNPKNWASIAFIGLGAVILIVVAVKLVAQTDTAKKVGSAALSAVPGGGAVSSVLKKGAVKSTVEVTKKAVAK